MAELSRARTFEQQLDVYKGLGPGYDQLRVGLSLSILFWHSFVASYGSEWALKVWAGVWGLPLAMLLPMFFGLSGFLVMGSAVRLKSLRTFITFRVLRILPALFTEITLSALVLGPILTASPLKEYFTSPLFFKYFLSLIGWVNFRLPGLFLGNPLPNVVNSSLWTVGPEILCYLILALLILFHVYLSRRSYLLVTGLYVGACILADLGESATFLDNLVPTRGLVLCFLIGNLLYLYREKIPYGVAIVALSGVASALLLYVAYQTSGWQWLSYFGLAASVYFVNGLGLTKLPDLRFTHYGDYSYGIYIFGFPVQQAVRATQATPDPWVNFAFALPITMLLAVLSWHFVEKPFLGLRKPLLGKLKSKSDRPRSRLTRLAVALVLALYALFVATVSNVFPIKEAAKQILLHTPAQPEPFGPVAPK